MANRKRAEAFAVLTPSGMRIIGQVKLIDGELLLVKRVRREAHFHKRFQAWAIQAEALPRLREAGVQAVRLEVDDGAVLQVSLNRLEGFGFRREFPPHGEQIFLRERFWHTVRPPRGQPKQLTLFAAGGSS